MMEAPLQYCIRNAPKQHGDLWVRVVEDRVEVLDPAGAWWRGRSFSVREFNELIKQLKEQE